jgi:hypothetical protein
MNNYDFEVCDNKNAWWFFLEGEQQTVRIEMAISLIYELKHAPSTSRLIVKGSGPVFPDFSEEEIGRVWDCF